MYLLTLISTSQTTNTSLWITSWQHPRWKCYNVIPRSRVNCVASNIFLGTCGHTLVNTSFVIYVGTQKERHSRYTLIHYILSVIHCVHSSEWNHVVFAAQKVAPLSSIRPLSQMHVSLKETELMKADLEGMKSYRKAHGMMDSDDFPEVTVGDKHARASSASSVGGVRKSSRYQ